MAAVFDLVKRALGGSASPRPSEQAQGEAEPAEVTRALAHLAGVERVVATAAESLGKAKGELEALERAHAAAVAAQGDAEKAFAEAEDDAGAAGRVVHTRLRVETSTRALEAGRERVRAAEGAAGAARSDLDNARRELETVRHRLAGDLDAFAARVVRPGIAEVLEAIDCAAAAWSRMGDELAKVNDHRKAAGLARSDGLVVASALLERLAERGTVDEIEGRACRTVAAGDRPFAWSFQDLVSLVLGLTHRGGGWSLETVSKRVATWRASPTLADAVRTEAEAERAEAAARRALPVKPHPVPHGRLVGQGKKPAEWSGIDSRDDQGETMHDRAPAGKKWDAELGQYVDDFGHTEILGPGVGRR